jgi:phage terminase large subunit-like protein
MPQLEDEMTTWVPGDTSDSPNRIDALVWSIIEDMEGNSSGIFV